MSHIGDLIRELCPDGVEFKALGEAGEFVRGKRFVKKDMIESGVPCIHYGEIYTKYGVAASNSISFVSEERAKSLRFAQPGDVIMVSAGETIEDIGKSVAWLGSEPIAIHDACYSFSSPMDAKYVSYFFASRQFRDQIRRHISSSKISSISTQNVATARIPAPPMEVQREIVRVLDLFQSLEAELEAELEARRLQYEHYRDSLLTFREQAGIGWMKLGEIATFTYGYTAIAQHEGALRFVRITDIDEFGKLRPESAKYVESSPDAERFRIRAGDLLVARTGASYGKTALIGADDTDSVYASFLIRIGLDLNLVNPGYYWHFAQSAAYWTQADSLVSVGGQPQFNANVLTRIRVPVPPPEEQRRIVAILDKFDALVNDLSIGLPAELAARRKQYEYYRDRLLTFPERAA